MTPQHALDALIKVFGLYLLVRNIQDVFRTSLYVGVPLTWNTGGFFTLMFFLLLSIVPLLLIFKTHWFTRLLRIQALEAPFQEPSLLGFFTVGIVALAGAKLFLAVVRMLGFGIGMLLMYLQGGVPDAWRSETLVYSVMQIVTQGITIALCLLALRHAPQLARWLHQRQQG